jgi:large subunit ribosomal protein L1
LRGANFDECFRYLRAFEVGQPPNSIKYDLAVKLKTLKNGPVLRNRIRLPHPVKTNVRVAVICPENSTIAAEARQLGAVAAGEESLFSMIQEGRLPFDRLVCHADSEAALKRANLGKILGPKGLMPNVKTKTITNDIKGLMRDLVGADEYRERNGVVRMSIGQLGFTPEMVSDNVKRFMGQLNTELNALEDVTEKRVDEVVFSSTHGPGFSLNGGFQSTDESLKPEHLAGPM